MKQMKRGECHEKDIYAFVDCSDRGSLAGFGLYGQERH
jgi:hypothetical protein